jgi:hypothetical protein
MPRAFRHDGIMSARRWGPLAFGILLLASSGARAAGEARPATAATNAPASAAPANIYEAAEWTTPETAIDKYVFTRLAGIGVRPAPCSDAVFVRRAFLDVLGVLPTALEARGFIEDKDPNKRIALIDKLLQRDEYADYWAMKWSDLLRVKAEFPVNLWPNAAQAYHRWLVESMRDNKPYDRFVRELLTSNGSNFRVGPVNFYRATPSKTPEGLASVVALTFMGSRANQWPSNMLTAVSAFFSQISYKPSREWKEEIVYWDPDVDLTQATNAAIAAAAAAATATNAPPPAKGATNAPVAKGASNAVAKATNAAPAVVAPPPPPKAPRTAIFPDGTPVALPPGRDPREIFADWLITPENPWFTKCIVNRAWYWLMGRGIIHEPDDIRGNNPPSNPALLAHLQREFVAGGYNLKRLFRLILTSRTYQVSSVVPKVRDLAAVEANFGFYPLRQMEAEVLIDAINGITRTTDLYTSPIPEPFTFIPENKPAVALPDGSITSAFLELFGRPARATGQENERANRTSPSQRMHMLNSSHIQRKFEDSPVLKAIMESKRPPKEITTELYLAMLSRFPTEGELKAIDAYTKKGVTRGREAWIDLVWALINTDEFRYRH